MEQLYAYLTYYVLEYGCKTTFHIVEGSTTRSYMYHYESIRKNYNKVIQIVVINFCNYFNRPIFYLYNIVILTTPLDPHCYKLSHYNVAETC